MPPIGVTRLLLGGSTWLCGGEGEGSLAAADSVTLVSPAGVVSASKPMKLPGLAESNVTATVVACPGASLLPMAGRPLTAKGMEGICTPSTSSVVPPVLVNVTSRVSCVPTAVELNSSASVDGVSAAGMTPSPLKCTSCSPSLSFSPLILHTPLAGPVLVGVNLTVSVRLSPGWIVVPSGSVVVAVKSPPIGGFEIVRGTVVPPVFSIVKLLDSLCPIGTWP